VRLRQQAVAKCTLSGFSDGKVAYQTKCHKRKSQVYFDCRIIRLPKQRRKLNRALRIDGLCALFIESWNNLPRRFGKKSLIA
jgi:tRNA(His) 5'-end guanylyltransferase